MVNLADHRDMVIGDRVIIPGHSESFHTGDWRSALPVIDMEKCINCLNCWVFCPDDCILVKDGEVIGVKETHCKGCGICAKVCPKQAITMTEGK
jgi:pyruvate ferredoxin oxidoreductase delta subunit